MGSDNLFVLDKDGKPVFTGHEDTNNPPVKPMEGAKIECPICHTMVDYLLGNTRKGCEGCFDKSKDDAVQGSDVYDSSKEIL